MKPPTIVLERDPFAAREDRTPDEIAAIRAFAAQLDRLLDAPLRGPLDEEEEQRLDVTQDALPSLAASTEAAPIITEPLPDAPPRPLHVPPEDVGLETGLADRMRGVLRGVLERAARKNRSPR